MIETAPASPATAGGGGGVPAAPNCPAVPGSAGSGAKETNRKGRQSSRPPNGGNGGGGKKEGGAPKAGAKTDLKDVPCYFHTAAKYGVGQGCSQGAACSFSHRTFMSKADFEAAERPRSASASRRSGKGGGKGKSSAAQSRPPAAGKRTVPYHCNKFLKDGVCPYEKDGKQCKYPHLTQAEYDAELAKMKASSAAGAGT